MSSFTPVYRMTVYAPRSVDSTEATVLTPIGGAAHSEEFKVTTVQGVAGWKAIMQAPTGRKGALNPLSKITDKGEMNVRLLDLRTSTGNATRWVTAFIGDSGGYPYWRNLKVKIEEDTGSGFTTYFTGRITNAVCNDLLWWDFQIRDMSDVLDMDIFVGPPHSSVSYAKQNGVLPISFNRSVGTDPMFQYGEFGLAAIAGVSVFGSFTSGTKTLTIVPERGGIQAGNRITKRMREAGTWYNHNIVGTPLYRLQFAKDAKYGGTEDVSSWRVLTTAGNEYYLDAVDCRHHNDRINGPGWHGERWHIRQVSGGPAVPSNGTEVKFIVLRNAAPTEDSPIIIGNTHPVQLIKDMLDGKFSHLKTDGSTWWSIAYNATNLNNLIADTSFFNARMLIYEKTTFEDFLEDFLPAYNLSYRFNSAGEFELCDLRRKNSYGALNTFVDSDLMTSGDNSAPPVWEYLREPAITVVDIETMMDFPKNLHATGHFQGEFPDPKSYVDSQPRTFSFVANDGRSMDLTPKTHKIKAHMWRHLLYGTSNEYLDFEGDKLKRMQAEAEKIALDIRGSYGAGPITYRAKCRRTSTPNATQPGDWCIVNWQYLPNTGSNVRGGARLALCLERMEDGLGIEFAFLDAGANAACTAPTLGQPTLNGTIAVDVPITVNASSEPVTIHCAYTLTSVGTVPVEASPLWQHCMNVTSTGTHTTHNHPKNRRIWFRARSESASSSPQQKLPSAWVFPNAGPGYVATASLGAVTGLATSGTVYANIVTVAWTNTESAPQIELLLATGTGPATWTAQDHLLSLPGSSTVWTLRGLAAGTQYTLAVRYIDENGGTGTIATVTFTTHASNKPTAPRPAGIDAARQT